MIREIEIGNNVLLIQMDKINVFVNSNQARQQASKQDKKRFSFAFFWSICPIIFSFLLVSLVGMLDWCQQWMTTKFYYTILREKWMKKKEKRKNVMLNNKYDEHVSSITNNIPAIGLFLHQLLILVYFVVEFDQVLLVFEDYHYLSSYVYDMK